MSIVRVIITAVVVVFTPHVEFRRTFPEQLWLHTLISSGSR